MTWEWQYTAPRIKYTDVHNEVERGAEEGVALAGGFA